MFGNGGGGDDVVTGQSGLDVFEFRKNGDNDKVTNFVIGMDKVAVASDIGFTDFAGLSAVISGSLDAVIQFSATDSMTLLGIDAANLSAADFSFFAVP